MQKGKGSQIKVQLENGDENLESSDVKSTSIAHLRSNIPENRLANLCSPKGILLHPENSCLIISMKLDPL